MKRSIGRALPMKRDGDGRVHLIVRRDASGAPQALELSAPLFAEEWQNSLATSAASTAYGILQGSPTWKRVVELTQKALSAAAEIGANALSRANQTPACHKGCSHCCHHPVGVSPPEVFALVDYIDAHFTVEERAALSVRVERFVEETANLSDAERYSPRYACPLLVSNQCSVYPARPLTCRGTNSLSEKSCEESLQDAHKRVKYVAGEYVVPRYLEPIRAAHAIAAGIQLSLSELHGLDMTPIELSSALGLLLNDTEGVTASWLRGDAAFTAARRALDDESSTLRLLSGKR